MYSRVCHPVLVSGFSERTRQDSPLGRVDLFIFIYLLTLQPYKNTIKLLKNSLIIHEENTKKNHKRVVSVYMIQIHVDLHKL
jgi:hypothetical protein